MCGDEFLLILPDTRIAEGMLAVEKIRLAVGESPLRLASETVRVTASLGVLACLMSFVYRRSAVTGSPGCARIQNARQKPCFQW